MTLVHRKIILRVMQQVHKARTFENQDSKMTCRNLKNLPSKIIVADNHVGVRMLICVVLFAGYFWHISDIHLDTEYSTSEDSNYQCRRTYGASNRRPGGKFGKFGDYNCDSPWALVESAALAMKRKQGENIEFVLWTGDGITASSSREHQMKVLQNLTDLLKHTFSSQFVFPVLGHDDPTPGLHYGLGYEDVGDLWKHWLPSEAIQTFNKGGYYTIEQKERKLRIIALNTNLCSDIVGNADDPAGQWQWLEETLNKSQRSGETVYLVGHMPPGVDERLSGSFIYQQQDVFQGRFNQRYIRLVRKYAHVIVGQFFGHLHSDSFRIIYDENGVPVSWIFISPAVSPKGTVSGPNNPGLRLYKFDANSGQVLDYQQYYLDLSAANQRGVANWQAEYNLSDYYGLKEISAQDLNKLADNFGSSDGTNLFSRYYRANSVRVHQSTSGCESSCAHTHYCAITRLDYTEFRSCLESAASALASSATSIQHSVHYSFLVFKVVYIFMSSLRTS